MVIQLTKCSLRDWRDEDVADLVRYANNRAIYANLRNAFPHPYTEADARQYIAHARELLPVRVFAIDVNEHAIGSIALMLKQDVYARTVEIGYWLAEEFWGQGIATCAVKGLVEYISREFDPIRIFACCFSWNPASGRVLEKAGFHLEARLEKNVVKDGRVGDELIYALIRK